MDRNILFKLNLAEVFINQGNTAKAVEHYNSAKSLINIANDVDLKTYLKISLLAYKLGFQQDKMDFYALANEKNLHTKEDQICMFIYHKDVEDVGQMTAMLRELETSFSDPEMIEFYFEYYEKTKNVDEMIEMVDRLEASCSAFELVLFYWKLATLLFYFDRYSEAVIFREKILNVYIENKNPIYNNKIYKIYTWIGETYQVYLNDPASAVKYYENALERQDKVSSRFLIMQKPIVANAIGNLHRDFWGNHYEALSEYQKALEMTNNVNTHGLTYSNIGVAYQKVGDFPEAAKNFEIAAGLFDREIFNIEQVFIYCDHNKHGISVFDDKILFIYQQLVDIYENRLNQPGKAEEWRSKINDL